jgi:hypothetical protein
MSEERRPLIEKLRRQMVAARDEAVPASVSDEPPAIID